MPTTTTTTTTTMSSSLLLLLTFPLPALTSHAFYVGSALTASGGVLLGGTGEEVSSHHLQLFPARDHAANSTITVGVTPAASLPGNLLTIPQVPHTHRYLSMEYSDFEGFPAPLTNGGVNEHGVGVRDVWASNRDELYYMTPDPQTGLQYSDLARLVLERAATAREGVQLIGELIGEFGYATYGGNTHLIADGDEGWVVWEFAGGRKLWAAERLGRDQVRVLYPGYIEEFPTDFEDSEDFMASADIVDFAVEMGWWDPDNAEQEPFNIFKVYGPQGDNYSARDGGFKYMTPRQLEEATLAMAPVTEADMMERVRDPRISDDEAGYGQVVTLFSKGSEKAPDSDLIRVWNAPTGSLAAPYVPWWLGVDSIPPEFGQHRYLTKGSPSTFLNPDYQLQEATAFAGRLFKRVMYYMCSAPKKFLPVVTDMLTGFEEAERRDVEGWVEEAARALIETSKRDEAKKLLTYYSHSKAGEAMQLGRRMADALDSYVKFIPGMWRDPTGDEINDAGLGAETVNCLVGIDPDKPADQQGKRAIRELGRRERTRRGAMEL